MTRLMLYACIALAFLTLVGGYFVMGINRAAISFGLLGMVWLVCIYKAWRWTSVIAMITIITASAAGVYLELQPSWMLIAVIYALFAWDLTDFDRRLTLASPDDDRAALERDHLTRLIPIFFISILVSVGDLGLRIRFTFEWALGLIVLSIGGISAMLWWLRRE
jgi:hypothetical protein